MSWLRSDPDDEASTDDIDAGLGDDIDAGGSSYVDADAPIAGAPPSLDPSTPASPPGADTDAGAEGGFTPADANISLSDGTEAHVGEPGGGEPAEGGFTPADANVSLPDGTEAHVGGDDVDLTGGSGAGSGSGVGDD